jgi:hypothetical protein
VTTEIARFNPATYCLPHVYRFSGWFTTSSGAILAQSGMAVSGATVTKNAATGRYDLVLHRPFARTLAAFAGLATLTEGGIPTSSPKVYVNGIPASAYAGLTAISGFSVQVVNGGGGAQQPANLAINWTLEVSDTTSVPVAFVAPAIPPGPPLTGLQLWLKADAGVTQAGGLVSAWADQSGNNNHATQATGAKQPTYNAASINGLPGITFGGALLTALVGANNIVASLAARTVLVVAKQSGAGGAQQNLLSFRLATSPAILMLAPGGGTLQYWHDATNDYNATGQPNWANTPVAVMLSTAGGGSPFTYAVNGTTYASGSTFNGPETGTAGYVVGNEQYFSGQPFFGDICEVLVWDHVLSADDLAAARAYLNGRWGVS